MESTSSLPWPSSRFLQAKRASAQNATATILNGGLPGITLPVGGGFFTFDINLTTTFPSLGITYFLRSNDGSGFFCISELQTSGSPFGYCPQQPEPASPINPPPGHVWIRRTITIWAVSLPTPISRFHLASYFISTIILSYSTSLAPGVYHIFFDPRTIVADANFNDHGVTANQFTVTIVPAAAKPGSR